MSKSDVGAGRYEFDGGYPTAATIERAYDDVDLNRAVYAYWPRGLTVSSADGLAGLAAAPS